MTLVSDLILAIICITDYWGTAIATYTIQLVSGTYTNMYAGQNSWKGHLTGNTIESLGATVGSTVIL
ncbi:hypothetical protein EXU85_14105 [Spirosoma sp. KCTC 42546]|uniref:hypothetical protein n=1 Tax=Spirosoma sp. KCTC 42546 TaxID=2520506 RepID=UPI001157D5C4|nr:hypothetical protein [Spirosoma sp. KCTC 42546]QDK79677.1 hypothetical protein EXU85_14105 [Spirosoma sp. KCTC 42546]